MATELNLKEVEHALAFAMNKHNGQERKFNGFPYVTHPITVAIAAEHYFAQFEIKYDPTTLVVAAILHDTIEDTGTDYDEIMGVFGKPVAEIVNILTRRPTQLDESYEDYINRVLASDNIYAIVIKMMDCSHNNSDVHSDRYNVAYSKLHAKFRMKLG